MPTIHTKCPNCRGEIALAPERVALLRGPAVLYGFACPSCQDPVLKVADRNAVNLLETAGVSADGPVELLAPPHPEQPGPGPAFSHDDLLTLHELLADERWIADLLDR